MCINTLYTCIDWFGRDSFRKRLLAGGAGAASGRRAALGRRTASGAAPKGSVRPFLVSQTAFLFGVVLLPQPPAHPTLVEPFVVAPNEDIAFYIANLVGGCGLQFANLDGHRRACMDKGRRSAQCTGGNEESRAGNPATIMSELAGVAGVRCLPGLRHRRAGALATAPRRTSSSHAPMAVGLGFSYTPGGGARKDGADLSPTPF